MSASRTFVIGDIHGCVDEVERLLEYIAPTPGDTVVFLGDYVDRGPSAKGVIDRLLRLQGEGPRCVFLKGNHEDMFLAFLGYEGRYPDAFLINGGEATLRSYGLEGCAGPAVARTLPPEHLQFLRSLQLYHPEGEFLCVHGGLSPVRPLDEQISEDLLWIREEFIASRHPFPFTILFGHTPSREVFIDLPYKIGLDTGLVYWNKLSCLELREKELYQIRRGERAVQQRSLQRQFADMRERRPAADNGTAGNRNNEGAF
ncbi:MAG: putative phosphohydrolase [Deltaproteobacteria bacterium]|nr:putative phosphohydrolase [Deltaproteobacteria bacterium]